MPLVSNNPYKTHFQSHKSSVISVDTVRKKRSTLPKNQRNSNPGGHQMIHRHHVADNTASVVRSTFLLLQGNNISLQDKRRRVTVCCFLIKFSRKQASINRQDDKWKQFGCLDIRNNYRRPSRQRFSIRIATNTNKRLSDSQLLCNIADGQDHTQASGAAFDER